MRKDRLQRTGAVLSVFGVVLVLPTAAGAVGVPSASFVATVQGTQTSTATLEEPGGECGPGTSSDTIDFASAAPFRVKVTSYRRTLTVGNGQTLFRVDGTTTRSNAGAVSCHDDRTRPSDCATKSFSSLKMALEEGDHLSGGRWHSFAVVDFAPEAKDVFENCTSVSPSRFPQVAPGDGVDLVVPKRMLLDRHKQTIVATGTHTFSGEGAYASQGTTTITVKLTLKRL